MGFFSDLKEDLSLAVNELMPEEDLKASIPEETTEDTMPQEAAAETIEEQYAPADEAVNTEDTVDLEKMLANLDATQWPEAEEEEGAMEEAVIEEETPVQQEVKEEEYDLESMLASAIAAGNGHTEEPEKEKIQEYKGAEKKMDSYAGRVATDETSVITAGMTIAGDITSEGSVDLIGCVNGNIDILGKLNVTGHITGNSKASEIFAEGAKINGEIISSGAVKIGASSVVIGNISATSAAIAGAIKGDIDVKGPVVLDSSAIVMGNIKSKSVQINNGAVIEGMCSQCYAEVSPTTFFDDYKPEIKKTKK